MSDHMEIGELLAVLAERGPGVLSKAAPAFLLEEASSGADGPRARVTRIVDRVDLNAEQAGAVADPAKRRVFRVVAKDGSADAVAVGRGDDADVRLELASISTLHATFHRADDGAWTLEDAGSRNGTFLDGDRLPARAARPIASSSIVRFGPQSRFTFMSAEELESFLQGLGAMMKSKGAEQFSPDEQIATQSLGAVPLPSYLDDDDDDDAPPIEDDEEDED